MRLREQRRKVGTFHEAVTGDRPPEIGRDFFEREPLGIPDPGNLPDNHGQDEQPLVQGAIVLDVPDHDWRGIALGARQEHRRAGHARNAALLDPRHELGDRHERIMYPPRRRSGADMPDHHDEINAAGKQKGDVSALRDLHKVCAEEGKVDHTQHAGHRDRDRQAPLQHLAHGDEQQRRRHQHGGRDGDAVGGREIVGLAEPDGEADRDDHQQPVDGADVDLAVALRRRLRDLQARHPAELNRLPRHGKRARDDRLTCDDGRDCRQHHERNQQRGRTKPIEDVV